MNLQLLIIRKQAGLTQKEFAEKVGIEPNRYSRIERDEIKPTIDEAFSIGDAFDCDPREIFLSKIAQKMRNTI